MKKTKLVSKIALMAITGVSLVACTPKQKDEICDPIGTAEIVKDPVVEGEKKSHKDEAIYSATIDGVKKDNLTWAQSYDAVIAKTKVTTGDERIEYLHQAEDILMSTGAICPLYYYTDIFMKDKDMKGYYSSPLGYKFFHRSTVGGSKEFTICVGPKGDSYDPALNSAVDGAIVISHAFEGLYRWKQPTEGVIAGELEPGQAASYTKKSVGSEGHVLYTFKLRDGLKYSDGSELKASDFADSWDRAASSALAADYGYMFDCIVGYEQTSSSKVDTGEKDKDGNPIYNYPLVHLSGVTANDTSNELSVELVSDVPYFLELTAFPTYAPIKNVKNLADDWWTNASTYIGNGPMKVTKMDNKDGGSIVFERNTNYWDDAKTQAEKVTFALSDDDNNQLANFQKGDWKFIDSVPQDQIDTLKKDTAQYFVEGQLGTYYVIFNVNDPVLKQKLNTEQKQAKFRKALSLLIDRNYICKEIGKAGQEPANTFVGKGVKETHNGVTSDWTEKSGPKRDGSGYYKVGEEDFCENLTEAIKALRELGFTFDTEKKQFTDIPTLSYLYNAGTGHKAIAEYLEQAFGVYGIKLQLDSQEWATFLNTRKDGNFSIARNGWLADYNDACSFLDMWITGSGNNDAQFGR